MVKMEKEGGQLNYQKNENRFRVTGNYANQEQKKKKKDSQGRTLNAYD